MKRKSGFTLIELLVVVAIIGLLASIVLFALDQSRQKGRDANRASQMQEFVKAFELYYLENGVYPDDGVLNGGEAVLFVEGSSPGNDLRTAGYLSRVPADPQYDAANGYLYCASNDFASMAVLINTERDGGGTNYCAISRGPLEYSGSLCVVGGAGLNTIDRCNTRF